MFPKSELGKEWEPQDGTRALILYVREQLKR